LRLERIRDMLVLHIAPNAGISFRQEWVEQLRALPYEQYGDFLKDTIYPALTEEERKLWHKLQFSNRALYEALQAVI
jgi:hypothetical protein